MICNHSSGALLRQIVLMLLLIAWKPRAHGEMKTNPNELLIDFTLRSSKRMPFRKSREMLLKPEISLW